MKDRTESIKQIGLTVLALFVMIVIFGIFLITQGVNPITVYGDMIVSTLGNGYGIGQVVVKSSPFIMVAVATAISAKAGLVNVGGEGQFAIGALLSTFVAVFVAIHAGTCGNLTDACSWCTGRCHMERTCRHHESQGGNE